MESALIKDWRTIEEGWNRIDVRMRIPPNSASQKEYPDADCHDSQNAQTFAKKKDGDNGGKHRSAATSDGINQRDVSQPITALEKEVIGYMDHGTPDDEKPFRELKSNVSFSDKPEEGQTASDALHEYVPGRVDKRRDDDQKKNLLASF